MSNVGMSGYRESLAELRKTIEKLEIKSEIRGILLVGSVAKNEHIPSWSNIDLVVVFNKKNRIDHEMLKKIRKIVEKTSLKYEIPIWIKPFTLREFLQIPIFKKIEYMKDGEILLGSDLNILLNDSIEKMQSRDINKSLNEYARKSLNDLIYNWRRCYLSMNKVSYSTSPCHVIGGNNNRWEKVLLAEGIETIFCLAQIYLLLKDNFLYTKRTEIMGKLNKVDLWTDILSKGCSIRNRWTKIKSSDVKPLIEWCSESINTMLIQFEGS